MTTMLYDPKTLVPSLLVSQNLKDDDENKEFYVLNGAWYGIFNKGRITIKHPEYGYIGKEKVLKCYIFDGSYDNQGYRSLFDEFNKMVEEGVIKQ